MGALIFYAAIYFIGYYAAHLLNHLAGQGLIRSRRVSGLVLVVMVGMVHGYKIISTSPPHDHGEGAAGALALYVVMPVTIIAVAVLFLIWQEGNDKDR